MERLKQVLGEEKYNKWEAANKKFKELGPLAVTAEDHLAAGSTPPPELESNPGKTLADLMTDTEIESWLLNHEEAIKNLESNDDRPKELIAEQMLKQLQANYGSSINYLKTINRLPKRFMNKKG